MNGKRIRDILTENSVVFDEDTFLDNFWGIRFRFHKRELKKVDKTLLKPFVKAYYKEWCIEIF